MSNSPIIGVYVLTCQALQVAELPPVFPAGRFDADCQELNDKLQL